MENNDQPFESGPYSVGWVDATPGRCVVCKLLTVGSGLIGFKHSDLAGPLCDPCLMEFQPALGRLLLLANICRELADGFPDDPWHQDRRQAVLMAVARLYHAQESREWSMPPLGVLDLWERHGDDLAAVPFKNWLESFRGIER